VPGVIETAVNFLSKSSKKPLPKPGFLSFSHSIAFSISLLALAVVIMVNGITPFMV